MHIREAEPRDQSGIWSVMEPVIRSGETYPLPRDMERGAALAYWLSPGNRVFIAEDDGKIFGTYYLKSNNGGGGAHVCNCGYMTGATARGRGIGRALCMHSQDVAREAGFRAMQFNFVVSANDGAVRLWQACGFDIVGRLPGAFDHPKEGCVDALVMFQAL
jgi:ribosomal protein S18 acetylase RimI-like enzyme